VTAEQLLVSFAIYVTNAKWERREKCTRFWWESPKERECSEDQGTDAEWIRMDLREIGW
jgi:hypothetical protein